MDDVTVGGAPATLSSPGDEWTLTNGVQDNHWVLQAIAPCDLTPGVDSPGESSDSLGYHVYRAEGADAAISGLSTKCLGGRQKVTTVISDMPDGDLSYLDAGYTFGVRNTGTARK